MEAPLSHEELRHLLPTDLISAALDADYYEDPPTHTYVTGSPFKFGQGDLPPLESRIYLYLFQGTTTWDRRSTLKLSEELDLTTLADTMRSDIDSMTGRHRVLLMKSMNSQKLAEEVSAHVRNLKKPKAKKGRAICDSADKENINPLYVQYF